jgi:hypothetical protein
MEDSNASPAVAVDFPLHPNLVGKLLEVNAKLRDVEGLIRSHIKKQESQNQENIEFLFAENKDLLTDLSSPWNGFARQDIEARLFFLRRLLKTVELYQETFAMLQHTFTYRWRQDPRCHISVEGKTRLTEIHCIWKGIEGALSIVPNAGPYCLFLNIECERYMKKLKSATGTISLGDKLDLYLPEKWIELDMSQAPSLISQHLEESNIHIREDSLDVESGGPGDQSFRGKWRWLLVKEFQLIFVCLFVAIVYSALKSDPQTGFQIAAFLFAIGTTFLTIFRIYLKPRESKEAKIRLH